MYQTFQCSNCNSPNYIGQDFCGGCGQKLYYSCPQCGCGIETTCINCPNCRTTLYWPTQQSMHLPVERGTFKEQKIKYRHYQTQQKKRTNPFVLLSLSFVVIAIIIGGTVFILNALSQETLPATSTPAEAISQPDTIPLADNPSNTDNKITKITNMEITSIMETSAILTWITDDPATSQVEYGTTDTYGLATNLKIELVTDHSVTITDLDPDTTYYFRAKSINADGDEASYDSDQTFKTLAKVDNISPVISAINVTNISQSGCTITWTTDKPTTSQVEYGATTAYGSFTSFNKELVTNHSVTITGLQQSTIYHYIIKTKDDSGNETSSDKDMTFRTPASDSTVPSCCQ